MLTADEVHVSDINSEFYGTSTKVLMENAGKGVADLVKKEIGEEGKKILVFCGKGNNGGDGLVAARYLSKEYNVNVFLIGKPKEIHSKIATDNYKKIKETNVRIFDIDSLEKIDDLIQESNLIIDSMLGIGIKGDLREPYKQIVKKINKQKNKIIVSVDRPTGLGTKISIKPDYTATFHDVKEGMNKKNCGRLKIVDIKIPEKAIKYVGPGELKIFYPKPKKESHKGQNGRVLVIGGGPFYGAPALSTFAALRTGADLIFTLTPKKVARAITSYSPILLKPKKLAKKMAKFSPNLIVKELSDEDILVPNDLEIAKKYVEKIDTLLIGPGLGNNDKTLKAAKKIIKYFVSEKKTVVIDADAIKVIRQNPDIIKNSKTVLTPHTGEFKELTNVKLSDDINERVKETKKWAKKLDATIILKGHIDVISNGEDVKLNDVHNQAMTVGGTGDVLAGVTSAMMSKGVNPFNAARIAVFINGCAGNNAFEKKSYGLISTDIIEEIPNVLKKYL